MRIHTKCAIFSVNFLSFALNALLFGNQAWCMTQIDKMFAYCNFHHIYIVLLQTKWETKNNTIYSYSAKLWPRLTSHSCLIFATETMMMVASRSHNGKWYGIMVMVVQHLYGPYIIIVFVDAIGKYIYERKKKLKTHKCETDNYAIQLNVSSSSA